MAKSCNDFDYFFSWHHCDTKSHYINRALKWWPKARQGHLLVDVAFYGVAVFWDYVWRSRPTWTEGVYIFAELKCFSSFVCAAPLFMPYDDAGRTTVVWHALPYFICPIDCDRWLHCRLLRKRARESLMWTAGGLLRGSFCISGNQSAITDRCRGRNRVAA
jgi:hypothetical protein